MNWTIEKRGLMKFRIHLIAVFLLLPNWSSALTLSPGNFYGTGWFSYDRIFEYDGTGRLLGSLQIPNVSLRGIAVGPDGYLYVVVDPDPFGSTRRVDVIAADGQIIRSHSFSGGISGHAALGKIAFSSDGQQFYVATGIGIYRFNVGGSAGTRLTTKLVFDVDVLPSGELLVADGNISILSSAGILLSEITAISDPESVSGGPTFALGQVFAAEYSESENKTYVAMLSSNRIPSLFSLAGLSNVLVEFEHYRYGLDFSLTEYGKVLVGSNAIAPGMFTRNLGFLGQFEGEAAPFITAYPERIFTNAFD